MKVSMVEILVVLDNRKRKVYQNLEKNKAGNLSEDSAMFPHACSHRLKTRSPVCRSVASEHFSARVG